MSRTSYIWYGCQKKKKINLFISHNNFCTIEIFYNVFIEKQRGKTERKLERKLERKALIAESIP